ncbi:hypothetical protein GCM10025865_31930 [Paraoerskovia sediminicola]|uniref:Metallo-beta-lactamase domain-containing protein n=1 Tax=Paraoerskovia sediminicola TaxID=1138587 RepID=A0ABN6XGA3_9CELL|nr:hypothetical protein GCM10025865_31930 [Paraoerskovia sediminicola]
MQTAASEHESPAPGRDLDEVAPGVHVATAEIWSSLCTVVVATDGSCLVVDPGITADEIDGLARTIDDRGWRVAAGLSTHHHWDHVLWRALLGGAPRWASPATVAAARRSREHNETEADAAAPGHDHSLTGHLTALPVPDVATTPRCRGTVPERS